MKYIIDIPFQTDFITAVRMECGLPVELKCIKSEDLELYTEPDRKAIEDEVWEFLKKLADMDFDDYETVFYPRDHDYTYQEAKAKYEAWKKQKDEIKVGDEIESIDTPRLTAVITWYDELTDNSRHIFIDGGMGYSYDLKAEWRKTGRHFPQVEELLKAMKGEE